MDSYMKNLLKDVLLIFNGLFEGAFVVDKERKILCWNKVAEELSGFSYAKVKGKSCFKSGLQPFNDKMEKLCKVDCPIVKVLNDGNPREEKVFFRHKDGSIIPTLIKAFPLKNEKGEIVAAVEIFNESHELRKRRINELNKLASMDTLTHVFNRRGLEEHLKVKLKEYKIQSKNFGLVFLDVDNFKRINDNYGHEVGDRVLKEIGKILIKSFRKKDVLGRWAGDEFMGIFPEIDINELEKISEKLRCLIEEIDIGLKEVKTTVSIGGTLVSPSDTAESILKRVDKLMYSSKQDGKNTVIIG